MIKVTATGLVILAAGASTRLGQPKQTLLYRAKTLLQGAIDAGLQAGCHPIIVVTGAHHELVSASISNSPVSQVYNSQWREGMGSSIRCGIAALQKASPHAAGAILMVSDQPFADAALLQALMQEREASGNAITASFYSNTPGVPALFDSSLFPELLLLHGQEGAKKLFAQHTPALSLVPFPMGAIDIDTWHDVEQWQIGTQG